MLAGLFILILGSLMSLRCLDLIGGIGDYFDKKEKSGRETLLGRNLSNSLPINWICCLAVILSVIPAGFYVEMSYTVRPAAIPAEGSYE